MRLLEPIGSVEMSRDLLRVAAKIRDSERAAEAWPEALKSMTEALGAAGAACIVANKNSNSADWVCFSGLSERFKSDYVDHFAPLDPFLPHLNVAPRWLKLSDCLPQSLLRQSEWYNESDSGRASSRKRSGLRCWRRLRRRPGRPPPIDRAGDGSSRRRARALLPRHVVVRQALAALEHRPVDDPHRPRTEELDHALLLEMSQRPADRLDR